MIYAITGIQAKKCYFTPSSREVTLEGLVFRFKTLWIVLVGFSSTNFRKQITTFDLIPKNNIDSNWKDQYVLQNSIVVCSFVYCISGKRLGRVAGIIVFSSLGSIRQILAFQGEGRNFCELPALPRRKLRNKSLVKANHVTRLLFCVQKLVLEHQLAYSIAWRPEYKTWERIHRGIADPRLLAIPTSWGRVADLNPNWRRFSNDWLRVSPSQRVVAAIVPRV